MLNNQQVSLYLQQLQTLHPQAFKKNYLFYSQIKTKGMLNDLKEAIPWVLAAMIFISASISLGLYFKSHFPQWDDFQTKGVSVLIVMLFFMLIVPIIIKQIKHSSTHLYQQLRHTPIKIAILILLQAMNIAFIQSTLLQGVLFFLTLSFGFVKFYKENMFREETQNIDYYNLQQVRRICLWSYKQAIKTKFKLKTSKKGTDQYKTIEQQFRYFLDLHLQLIQYENKLCKTYKFIDLDSYMDSLM
ncbi:hypothetical protein [Acinetobacter sp. ANC 4648]|uniref:hypothetical protein n=1 Tax=Acinetobacter sp. ANC 4648 TaxID=1977875 RepID=UPI000A35BD0D|nr:hypothetical protein [Acinetobacter sp. ANC 4648]OTG84069.1 hypothetical protein B9T27_04305 [Acinetobacter sp. ANC 4648]